MCLPGMMKPTYGCDPGAPPGRRFESCPDGFVFHVRREQKDKSPPTANHAFTLLKSCAYPPLPPFFVITLLSFSHSEKFERAATCHTE